MPNEPGRDSSRAPAKQGRVNRRFLDQSLPVRILRGTVLALLLAAAAYFIPTPYVLEAPGRTVRASEMIRIKNHSVHPVNGSFLMTTVLAEPATLLLCVYGLLDPAATLTRLAEQAPGEHAQTPGDAGQMEMSQFFSTRVALEALGFKLQGDYLGLRILQLVPDSPNLGRLQAGDLLVSLQDKASPTLHDLKETLKGKSSQDTLSATVRRNATSMNLTLSIADLGGQPRIGAVMRPEYNRVKLPVDILFQSGNTSGASAGLVFALEIYDQLSPQDLARGRTIAATGTLDPRGRVGGIQGITYKLVSVERAGADIFVVPQENYAELQTLQTSVKIIPVSTFQEALDALR